MLNDKRRRRRIQDSVPRRLRRVPVGDDRLRRPGAARHDLPRAPRRDEHARPADLRVRRAGRLGARAGRAADRAVQAVPGSAGRARVAPQVPGVHHRPKARASSGTTRTSSSIIETAAGSGIGFLMGWRGKDGNKALRGEPNPKQWESTRRTTASSSTTCRESVPLHAQLEPRRTWTWPRTRAGARTTSRSRSSSTPTCCRNSASRRKARRNGRQPPDASARAHRHLLRPAAVLVSAARKRGDRSRARIRSPRSRSGRWRCTTRGIRRTPGCARSTATTTCT